MYCPITDWNLNHGSDIERIRMLQKYGGIYLDNDVYVIQNLDKYRKFECAINWFIAELSELGNQVKIRMQPAQYKLYNNLIFLKSN